MNRIDYCNTLPAAAPVNQPTNFSEYSILQLGYSWEAESTEVRQETVSKPGTSSTGCVLLKRHRTNCVPLSRSRLHGMDSSYLAELCVHVFYRRLPQSPSICLQKEAESTKAQAIHLHTSLIQHRRGYSLEFSHSPSSAEKHLWYGQADSNHTCFAFYGLWMPVRIFQMSLLITQKLIFLNGEW